MDAEEEREKKRVILADDPSNRAMVQRDLHLLPREILVEILSRLPITSLIHFKTTSHAGYDLIADPRLPPRFRNRVSDSNPYLILFGKDSTAIQGLYFVDSEGCSRRVRKMDPPQHSEVSNLVGSCNGLLCVSYPTIPYPTFSASDATDGLLIYNPFVGDAVRVQPADNPFLALVEVFGFGFHPRTEEFKVVRIVSYQKFIMVADLALVGEFDEVFDTVNEAMVQVFTVGTTEWRNKGASPPELGDFVITPPQALVEGSLHWVGVVGTGGFSYIFAIISFELADEVFEEIPHPPCQQLVSRGFSLSVLNGCLSAAGLVDTFDIWVMKQYRVKESWVKQFSFDPCFPGGWSSFLSRSPKVICALKNGEIILQDNDSSLVSYDPVENRFKTLQMSGLPEHFLAIPFLPSLFSAKASMNLQL
ncbi:hypothetical protein SLEP1_g25815 [Rubroshorea leprosula]|uniref:F-box domain-containing protein n=1 Tax=Rubroshorea leprosula TaxID=152421 RepID=A0AAV5JUI7_9ROSI|nr:hypothetical protein SLEP1_g25815 [Rubroshorea leprosula]